MKKWLREPLLHFLGLGLLIFVIYGLVNPPGSIEGDYEIRIDDGDVNRLLSNYTQNWNRLPDSSTFRNMLEDEIRSEIFYREGLALNLDHNDEIIRRRMRQKYEFLMDDFSKAQAVPDDSLKTWFLRFPERFQSPMKSTFYQIYFSPDKRSDPLLDARNWLKNAPKTPDSSFWNMNHSDPSPLKAKYESQDLDQIRQVFGIDFTKQFALAIESPGKLPLFLEPIESGFGVHVLFLIKRQQAEIPIFESVRDAVLSDYQKNRSESLQSGFLESIRDKYEIRWDLNDYTQWQIPID